MGGGNPQQKGPCTREKGPGKSRKSEEKNGTSIVYLFYKKSMASITGMMIRPNIPEKKSPPSNSYAPEEVEELLHQSGEESERERITCYSEELGSMGYPTSKKSNNVTTRSV